MSNSREQSLDENVVFLPVTEASPEFLHCEKERQAVERLLSAGPEAFYSSIGTERSGCFLSSEEVSQITSWAQDYHCNPVQKQQLENGEEDSSDERDFCSTYFPSHSDVPTPDLELGWPEKNPWVPKGSVTVHISPPAEGDPPVREIIRRHLQKASQVIAIATDRLTDGAIIGDLHNAASRGVPVYIILNQRSIQENFTLNRLRHPNMQVRVLGGKTFCSRAGRMVAGEMKEKFLLVDLETVIHGSYSLTWTDAHLHRQLITVLQGPVVESFDREFRILFAASLPVPDTWRVAGNHEDVTHQLKDFPHHRFHKQISWDTEIISPPSPPAGSLLDWEAMGVIQRDSSDLDSPFDQHEEHEEILAIEMPLQNNMLFAKNPPVTDSFTNNGNQFVDKKRVSKNTSPVTKNAPDKLTSRDPDYMHNNTQPSQTDPRPLERVKRNPDYLHNNTTPSQTDLRPPERVKRDTDYLHTRHSQTDLRSPDKVKRDPDFLHTRHSQTDLRSPDKVKRDPDFFHNNTTPSQTDLRPPERVKRDTDYLQTRHSQTDLRSPDKVKRDPDFLNNNTPPLQADLRPPERMKRNPDYLHSKTQPPQTDLMSPERMKRDPDYVHSNTQPSNMDLRPPEKVKRDPDYLHSKTQPPPTDLMSSERMKSRVERNIEKALARQLSSEQNTNPDDRTKRDDQTKESTHNMVTPSPAKRTERSRTGSILEEESSTSETSSKVENTPSSRKPLILRVPQSESFSSLSDIMKRLQLHESSPGRHKRGPKTAVSEMSRSMMDLSVPSTDSNHDEKGVPVPRFKAGCFDPAHTPASSLMKNRSEDMKPLLYRTPKNFVPRGRPRSSSYALNIDWRRSLAEMSSEKE